MVLAQVLIPAASGLESVSNQPPESGFTGSGSCSSTACHGSVAPRFSPTTDIRHDEHTIWINRDPHARAYQVLYNTRSQNISKLLAGPGGKILPAPEDTRCLACHTTPRSEASFQNPDLTWLNADGVSCEACHGPAQKWLGPHTEQGWGSRGLVARDQDDAQKESVFGFVSTKNLARRAEMCVGCHVGSRKTDGLAARDVNHDLIAAGHPRLAADFAAYSDMQPHHWTEKDRNRLPDMPARTWLIGQLTSARAAVELLKDRSRDHKNPWPELSETSCFSCHHALADEVWRRPTPDTAAQGSPVTAWATWSLAMLPRLSAVPETSPRARTDQVWNAISDLQETMKTSLPSRDEVEQKANAVTHLLGEWLGQVRGANFTPETTQKLYQTLNSESTWSGVTGWDSAVQLYLGLVSLRQSMANYGLPVQDAARLDEVKRKLEFPAGFDSPAGFNPATVTAP